MKRNIFIVLSGVLAAAAVMGWMRAPEPVSADESASAVSVNTVDEQTTDQVAENIDLTSEMAILKASHAEALKTLANVAVQAQLDHFTDAAQNAPRIQIATPDVAPNLDVNRVAVPTQDIIETVKNALAQAESLKDVKQIAMINVADGKLIASTDDENAKNALSLIQNEQDPSGSVSVIADNLLQSWHWYCANDTKTACLAVLNAENLTLTGTNACRIASKESKIACADTQIDANTAFHANDCENNRIDALNDQNTLRVDLGNGCALLVPKPASNNTTATNNNTFAERHKNKATIKDPGKAKQISVIAHGIFALGAGILVILIGIVCTRRKEEDLEALENHAQENDEEIQKLKEAAKASELESIKLKNQVDDLIKDRDLSEHSMSSIMSENAQLKEQLDYAKKTFKESSLAIKQLESEKELLEDKLASANRPEHTMVESAPQPEYEHSSSSKINLTPVAETPQSAPNPTRQINDLVKDEKTKAADKTTTGKNPAIKTQSIGEIEELANLDSDLSSLGEDGWDEIAASFDSLFTDTSSNSNPKVPSGKLDSDLLKPLSDTAVPYTQTPAKTGVSQSTFNPTTRIHKAGHTNESDANTLNSMSAVGPAVYTPSVNLTNPIKKVDQPKSTVMGIGGIQNSTRLTQSQPIYSSSPSAPSSTETMKPVPSLSKPSDSNIPNLKQEKLDSSFKPSPSWTGAKTTDGSATKRPGDSGLSAAALLEAAKKRAKDVSELNPVVSRDANASPSQSGALDFNRSMSKSGIFSLTGSRANIRLKSDPEYFKELYAEYSAMQRQNGEEQKYNCEQFVTHMAAQKASLIKTYNCKDIKFTIYLKNGKTSIKASPIRDK